MIRADCVHTVELPASDHIREDTWLKPLFVILLRSLEDLWHHDDCSSRFALWSWDSDENAKKSSCINLCSGLDCNTSNSDIEAMKNEMRIESESCGLGSGPGPGS